MFSRPRFLLHFHVDIVPGEGVVLMSETRHSLLRGGLYELVVPCLDGRTPDDVCARLRAKASAAEVYYALTQLECKGYLGEEEPALPAAQAALWSSQQVAPRTAVQRLAQRPVVVGTFGVEAGPFRELLETLHVRLADEGPPDVILTDGALRDELRECNAAALRDGRPWLLVKPAGRQVWVGPLFRPGKRGCWECLAQRLGTNFPVAAYLQGRNCHAGPVVQDRAATPATLQVGWGLAPCAIGGGDADLFDRAAGTDYCAETSVGEFLLGNPRPQPVGRVG
jgi:ribosomal protein S12 methylthiotransferase accessory factor